MIFVLVDPAVARLGVGHELVVAEARVDKRVDERAGQVLPRRLDRGRARSRHLEVRLVDVLEGFGLGQVERLAELAEVLAEPRVVERLDQRLVLRLDGDVRSREDVGELALEVRIRRRVKVGLNHLLVVQADRQRDRLGQAVLSTVDGVGGPEEGEIVGRDEVVDARDHVPAHARVRVLVHARHDRLDVLELEQQVDRVRLAIVRQQERHQPMRQLEQLLRRLRRALSRIELLAQLGRQMSARSVGASSSVGRTGCTRGPTARDPRSSRP